MDLVISIFFSFFRNPNDKLNGFRISIIISLRSLCVKSKKNRFIPLGGSKHSEKEESKESCSLN